MRYFVQRRDVKAVQHKNGAYQPVREYNEATGLRDGPFIPFSLQDMQNHLDKKITYGHYLMDSANMCRVFAFDIDLNKSGYFPTNPGVDGNDEGTKFNPVAHWMSRRPDYARSWIKYQFRMLAEQIAASIRKELELPSLIAYSGSKGMHVYALTGSPISGEDARAGLDVVLDALGIFVPVRGRNFFRHVNENPVHGYPNFTVEVFPKQERVDNKKEGLGNLMRLPLGCNQKSKDPTFFVDCSRPMGELVPLDPYVALTTLDPWRR